MWQSLMWRNAISGIVLVFSLGLAACSSGGGGSAPPPTGTLTVSVSDSSDDAAIAGARVTVIDGASGDIIDILTTDANGTVSTTLLVGQVQLRVAAQGYQSSPASIEGFPMPYAIVGGQTTGASFALTPLADAGALGWITGRALHTDGTTGVANALIIASTSATGSLEWHTTATDLDGSFVLFNVPATDGVAGTADDITVTALRAGYNFVDVTVEVAAEADTAGTDILSTEANGSLSGHITFLSTTNVEVDVTLLHPDTGAVIPGLSTMTSGYNYTLNGIPDGIFDALASLNTDGKVLDPDYVYKFGIDEVVAAAGVVTPNPLDFSVTGAVSLNSPVNFQILPINALTFSWAAYPSANHYMLEVRNDHGDVIWGSPMRDLASNYTVDSSVTQVTFDPAWANEALVEGKLYHVRVYASKNINTDPFYKLISASEDLEGVFKVGPEQ